MSDKGVCALAKALEKNTALASLDLRYHARARPRSSVQMGAGRWGGGGQRAALHTARAACSGGGFWAGQGAAGPHLDFF